MSSVGRRQSRRIISGLSLGMDERDTFKDRGRRRKSRMKDMERCDRKECKII